MGQDTFFELSRRSVLLSKNDGMYLSWRDSVINVRTDKGMNFFEFSYNLQCLDKNIDVVEFSIPSPKSSPASVLCKSKFINSEMKNYDYTEMIIDSSFWPHNNALTQEMTNVAMSSWSPPYFFKNKSVLAILNNIGGVEIFMQQQYKWKSILNLSLYIQNSLEYNKTPKNFDELKKSVYIVETSSICWAPKLNPDHSCFFVTAQKNAAIIFWQIFNKMEAPIMIGQIQCNMSEIKNILWVQQTVNKICLICADILGQINAIEIQIESDSISLLNSYILWQHKDRMIASHLNYMIINDNIMFFYSKHRHFIVQVLDKNFNVITQYVNNINDYRITDITNSLDGYYLTTINIKIFKLNISLAEGSVTVDYIPVELKESFPTYELYGLCFSNTNMLCALGMIDRRVQCRKEVLKIDIVFVTTDSKLDSLVPTILCNPKKKLTAYWDCIEMLRYKINKMKKMPILDYKVLHFEVHNDVYKLKIYLILLIFYLNLRRLARVSSDLILPELSVEKLKEKILLMQAESTIQTLYQQHKKTGELNSLEHESFVGCLKYLEFYSKKHKTEVTMDNDVLNIVKTKLKYMCQSCDDEIDGFTCKSGHINMYCMLSFIPITNDDYLICKCCGSTARTDVCLDDPLCVFCDQRLVKPD